MGTDLSVVNAARVSFDKESDWVTDQGYSKFVLHSRDINLIHYLAKHDHWTPFAHTAITLRMQAPVPIRTQCFKHKQGFVENEESRRYINTMPDTFMPEVWRKAAANKKQGSLDEPADPILRIRMGGSQTITSAVQRYYNYALDLYKELLDHGVCPEQARFVLPQGVEVQWIWTGNLYSYANFYLKRTDPNAQKEVRDLAQMVSDIIGPLFPISWKALTEKDM